MDGTTTINLMRNVDVAAGETSRPHCRRTAVWRTKWKYHLWLQRIAIKD